jgi:hypothetical protein
MAYVMDNSMDILKELIYEDNYRHESITVFKVDVDHKSNFFWRILFRRHQLKVVAVTIPV